jgi:hypothetical protein
MSDSDESDSFYSDPQRIFAKLLPEEKRPVAYLTPNEAAAAVDQARNELFLIYDRLHHVVQLHESTIRKRWMKVRTLLLKSNGLPVLIYEPGPPETSGQAASTSTGDFPKNSSSSCTRSASIQTSGKSRHVTDSKR